MENLERKIEYQFIAAPLNLFYICDVYTYSLLLTLIQKETYWKSKNKLSDDGYFFMSIEEIGNIIYLDNRNDIRCTIESLYINRIIDVRCTGVGRGAKNKIANEFKINYEKIKEFDDISLFDIREFGMKITKLKRGSKVSYDSVQDSIQHSVQFVSNVVPTTIYNIDNLENKDNIEDIYNLNNKENNIYNNKYSNIYKEKIEEIANAETSSNNFDNSTNVGKESVSTDDVISKMFPELPIEDNSNEMANANNSNEMANANSSSNIDLNKSLEDNSNKTVISTENSSIEETSFNREQINSTDVDVNKANETANAKNNLKMKQEAKEYFKVIINEVNYLNRTNSTDTSKLKRYYDVLKDFPIDEDDKKEMLSKCNDYINEISLKKTANANTETSFNDNTSNKTDISTLNEKTTDTSTEETSFNTELKNNKNANVNKEESPKRGMEYNRYFNNIQVALNKRCLGTLVQYEKDFQKKVEYLSDEELDELRIIIDDAKQRVQLAIVA